MCLFVFLKIIIMNNVNRVWYAKYFVTLVFLVFACSSRSQNEDGKDVLPFQDITTYPDTYSSETMVARMIDGLGFRFYWATEGLTVTDLAYRPHVEARTSEETIDHIMGLSNIIINAIKNKPNIASGVETSPKTFAEKRKIILNNLFEARQHLVTSVNVDDVKIIFERKEGRTELPIWNLINGPIADAIWHVGQVVSFRRASGNPFNAKVNLMMGKLR